MTPLMIYNRHQDALHRYAMRLCRDPHLAADLTQQTFLRAVEHQDKLAAYPEARIEGWLILTLKRQWIDHLRARRAEDMTDAPPDARWDEDFTGAEVLAVLDSLPLTLRETVRLRHFQGLNATEIGDAMGVPAATVRTRLRAASKLLKARYLDEI